MFYVTQFWLIEYYLPLEKGDCSLISSMGLYHWFMFIKNSEYDLSLHSRSILSSEHYILQIIVER